MKKTLLCLSALAASATLSAQTTAPKPATTTAHTATHTGTAGVHHTAAAGGCVTIPTLDAKIPKLEATAPCPKALYTLTRTPDSHVDYVSPLISPEVKEGLGVGPSTFTLAYVDVTPGTGELIKAGKFLSVKYTGYLVDGTKFDSSEDHPGKEPIAFPYGQHRVIPGWDTGFEGMHVGGKRRLFIPYQLAYGEAGKPPVIPAKSELIFDVEVVSQSDTQPAPKPAPHPATPPPATPPPATKPDDSKPATPPPASSTTPPPAQGQPGYKEIPPPAPPTKQ